MLVAMLTEDAPVEKVEGIVLGALAAFAALDFCAPLG